MVAPRSLALVLALPCLLLSACKDEGHEGDGHGGMESKVGPAPKAEAKPEAKTEVEPETETKAAPGVQDDGSIVFAVDWFHGSVEQALAKAKAEDKLVFVDVGAYWCPPCHELDEKVFTDPKVGAWLDEHAVSVHIDAEKGEGPELVERRQIQAYPTMLVLESSGLEKGRIVDFFEAEVLIEKLEALAAGDNVLAELEQAVASPPEDQSEAEALEARYRLAHAYVLAAKREQAEALFAELLEADPENQAGVAAKVLYDQAMFLTLKLDGDPERAITEFEALQARFPASKEAVRAYRIIGRAHCKLDQDDEAAAALEAMVATDPEDVGLKSSFGWFAFRQQCRPDAGLKAVLAGIEQAPKDAGLRYLEAELRRLLDQPEAALAAIRKAAELEPESAYFKRQVRRFEELRGE